MTKYRLATILAGVILVFVSGIAPVSAQYSLGMSGLLNSPSADMQADGVFMAGGNFLPEEMIPEKWGYNSGNYFLNITFLPFVEVAYRCTLLKGSRDGNNWEQDRSVSLRLRPLKERRFLPSVVVGTNDAFTTNQLNTFKETKGNRYFSSVYAVATKNIPFGENTLGITAGSYLFSKNSLYKGVFGGVRFTPSFLKPVSVIVEYDSNNVNAGVAARLFNRFSIHVFSYDFKAVSGGLRYEFRLLNKQ